MVCIRCKKRPAVVFVTTDSGNGSPSGYCISCARELGIKPVNDLMDKMGITDEQIDALYDQMDSFVGEDGEFDMSSIADMLQQSGEDVDSDEDFMHGAPTFPFLKNMFSKSEKSDSDDMKKSDAKASSKRKKNDKHAKHKHLDTYCQNLTKRAADGQLDRIIGRDNEIGRVIQILSRRTKNNPCLIGEPGVGKTAIAEGLAQRIASGDVPLRLQDKEIHLLDLTSLVAGTQFRGQFEARIKGLIQEVRDAGNIILFIDEVHNLVGTGDSEGTMNAANILKPALSRGEIQVIGATTFNEYRKYIEKDSALERRFQPVTVAEPSVNDTVKVLVGVKNYYEDYHKVSITDAMVRRAVVVSERYISDRFLPDKAIDLLDEACVSAALRNKDMEEYNKACSQQQELRAKEQEMTSSDDIDFAKLSLLRTDLARLNKRVDELKESAKPAEVTEDDIAHVIELWTGIPASRVQENELKKLADLDEKLRTKIVGQDEAVAAVASAIRRSRVQISPRRHPASFIFVGPTGVGKTELVKVLSLELFDSPETLIRLDMSEFMEKHSVSKIIGSPPGYVGYDEAGQVTEKVRRRPYSVLLFDEIEKAHPDVLNILLQILDEGRITDAHGRVVNFENTVIIMTSNAGSEKKDNILGFAKDESQASKEKAMKALSEFLRPEFLARVDEIISFNVLKTEEFKGIAKLLLNEYVDSLSEKGIEFRYDDKVVAYLAEKAMGGKSGARDLRNLIRREVEDAITGEIVNRGEGAFSSIDLGENDGKITLTVTE
ncbi:MAG: ATP-dependent Clp protease ATP-binding subunit [Lachnospiraceae bacterium]|nr:ATP-dependent Clp protease ATP-binding subunit [Lachnospiraceae bacterium]